MQTWSMRIQMGKPGADAVNELDEGRLTASKSASADLGIKGHTMGEQTEEFLDAVRRRSKRSFHLEGLHPEELEMLLKQAISAQQNKVSDMARVDTIGDGCSVHARVFPSLAADSDLRLREALPPKPSLRAEARPATKMPTAQQMDERDCEGGGETNEERHIRE